MVESQVRSSAKLVVESAHSRPSSGQVNLQSWKECSDAKTEDVKERAITEMAEKTTAQVGAMVLKFRNGVRLSPVKYFTLANMLSPKYPVRLKISAMNQIQSRIGLKIIKY